MRDSHICNENSLWNRQKNWLSSYSCQNLEVHRHLNLQNGYRYVVISAKAPSIFRWEVHHVLTKGDYEHPKNKVVKMRVFIKELQRKYSLSDDAIQHIIQIVEHRSASLALYCSSRRNDRYDPETGLMTLASQKYPKREDNRREVMRIVNELVKEGRTKFPAKQSRGCYIQRRYPRRAKETDDDQKEKTEQEIKEFFAMVDADGDGQISIKDWKTFFQQYTHRYSSIHNILSEQVWYGCVRQ